MEAERKMTLFLARRELIHRLDSSLLKNAAQLGISPSIEQVYRLHGLAETHFLLVNQYRFTAEDIPSLSRFADPLEVADQCRRVSGKLGTIQISTLLDEMNAYMRYPLVAQENQ